MLYVSVIYYMRLKLMQTRTVNKKSNNLVIFTYWHSIPASL